MDDAWVAIIVGLVLLALIALPIAAIIISLLTRRKLRKQLAALNANQSFTPDALQQLRVSDLAPLAQAIQQVETRTAKLEAALKAHAIEIAEETTATERPLAPAIALPVPRPAPTQPEEAPQFSPPPVAPPTASAQGPAAPRAVQAQRIESVIGRRLLGWAAVVLILFATAFFLKYAFDNRWIGELGRVTIGVIAGVTLTALGFRYYSRGWSIFSQILTAGGVVLLYLSVYAAFGYYHLASQKAAFIYLIILVAEAAALALLYEAPAIAVMALIGGFLAPILMRSDRDQYRSLFGYIAVLDVGALALLGHWLGLGSLAFAGTHLLFWLWYEDSYHPRKLWAVMIFQAAVFSIFLIAHLARRLIRPQPSGFAPAWISSPRSFFTTLEDLGLLLLNPFVFFATSYHLLDPDHHDWMGVFTVIMALIYAGAAKLLIDRSAHPRREGLLMIGIAITFVTLAIPVQLHSNWITIAWAVQAVVMIWAGIEIKSKPLQITALALFVLALGRLLLWDTPLADRGRFTPVLNKYFLSSMAVVVCLLAAALLAQKLGESRQAVARRFTLLILLVTIATLWFVMSVETFTYFLGRANAMRLLDDRRHELWLGQMALSVLWSIYAAALMAIGFVRRSAAIRWSALGLFALTVFKVMLIDIAVLQQLYRIIAFFVLGLLLLVVAWAYHRAFRARESST